MLFKNLFISFTALMLLSFSLDVAAQKGKTKSVIGHINPFDIDFIPKTIKINSTIKFKINNVNTFKVNGFTSSNSLNIDFDVPAVFADLIKGKIDEARDSMPKNNFKAMTTIESAIQNANQQLSYIKSLSNDKTLNTSDVHQIEKIFKLEKDSISLIKKIDSLSKLLIAEKSQKIKLDSSKFIDNFSSFIKTYQSIIESTALENKLAAKIKDSVFIRDIITLKMNIGSDFEALYQINDTSKAKIKVVEKITKLQTLFARLQFIYDDINKTSDKDSISFSGTLKTSDEGAEMKISNGYIKPNRKKYFTEQITFAKKALETITAEKNQSEIIRKAQAGIDLYNLIKNETFEIHTPAEQLKDDEVTLTPKLIFSDGKTGYEFKPVSIKTYGGFKVNFSTGYFLNFTGDDSYDVVKDSTGKSIGAVSTANNKITHALGGMIHAYPRWIKGPQPALSAGFSLAQNGNLGFYGGASLMFLEKNRLIISGGYSFNKIKQLNTSNLNQSNLFITQSDTQIRYNEVYKGSWFIGITYNLSK